MTKILEQELINLPLRKLKMESKFALNQRVFVHSFLNVINGA